MSATAWHRIVVTISRIINIRQAAKISSFALKADETAQHKHQKIASQSSYIEFTFGATRIQQCERFDTWVKKRLQNGAHQNTRQGGHHQKQPSRIKTSRGRDPLKSEEEGRFRLGFAWDATSGEGKRESSPRCGAGRSSSSSLPLREIPRSEAGIGEKGGKVGRHGKGREKATRGEATTQEESGGRGEARQTAMEGNQRGMGELAAPGRAYSEGSSSRSSAKNGCFASTAPSPSPRAPRALPSVAPGVCAPGADTHQAEEVGMAILQAGPVRHEAGTHPHSHNPHAIIPQPPTRKKETDRERERGRGREGETDSERERGRGALHTHK